MRCAPGALEEPMSALRRYLSPSGSGLLVALACSPALVVACAGAENQDVLVKGAASSSGNTTPGTSSGSSGKTSSGGTSSSGSSGDCPGEEEPNDHREEATKLAPLLCGTVSGQDKRDFVTFSLKESTQSMSIRFDGSVRLKVEIDGYSVATLTPQNAGAVPFVMGAIYMIEIESLTGSDNPVDWRIEVIEE
jgi:hypothetical protein